jgi:hypothetical protein
MYAVIGQNMYRNPLSVNSLRLLDDAGIDIAEFCDFDPHCVHTQAEEARKCGVTRQEINRRIQAGQYNTVDYHGRTLIKTNKRGWNE